MATATRDSPLATASSSACTLPYPERYYAAKEYYDANHKEGSGSSMSQDTQLMLYALQQQVTEGPCKAKSSGWGWNVVENTKLEAWKQLGNMSAMEAMRLFVRTIEEDYPNWYEVYAAMPGKSVAASPATSAGGAHPAAANGKAGGEVVGVGAQAVEGQWTVVETHTSGSKRPCPRYEHGAAILAGGLYIVGGNYAGRYLSDTWRLDLNTATWSPVTQQADAAANGEPAGVPLAPVAGHTVTQWGVQLLTLGGHVKAKTVSAAGILSVRSLDPSTGTVQTVETSGASQPSARGGHSATRIGNFVWVFGGEDATRKPLSDVHCLDLGLMVWTEPMAKDPATPAKGAKVTWPAPRSAHSAAAFLDRYVIIFGGGSAAACHADVWVLDTQGPSGPAWITVKQAGHKVTPRAGHSAVIHGNMMYVVGGGNNVKGCTEVLALDLTELANNASTPTLTWHSVSSAPARDPLSSEGMTVLLAQRPAAKATDKAGAVMIAFGGYNGKYHNTVSVMAPSAGPPSKAADAVAAAAAAAPAAATPTKGAAAAVVDNGAVAAGKGQADKSVSKGKGAASEVEQLKGQVAELQSQLAAAKGEAEAAVKAAAASAANEAHELTLIRKQLATTQAALETATKGLEDARAALARESAKVMRLEVENAELSKRLGDAAEERKELENLRKQIKELETKKGSGVWGYITGAS